MAFSKKLEEAPILKRHFLTIFKMQFLKIAGPNREFFAFLFENRRFPQGQMDPKSHELLTRFFQCFQSFDEPHSWN